MNHEKGMGFKRALLGALGLGVAAAGAEVVKEQKDSSLFADVEVPSAQHTESAEAQEGTRINASIDGEQVASFTEPPGGGK